MSRSRLALATVLVLLASCKGKPETEIPDDPESIILYSVDGTETWKGKTTGETLHGRPVLGSVNITDSAQRLEIVSAVKSAIRQAPPHRAACYWPRHVLRMARGGKTLDVEICFECTQYRTYHPDSESGGVGGGNISQAAEPLLNEILVKAGVEVVPNLIK